MTFEAFDVAAAFILSFGGSGALIFFCGGVIKARVSAGFTRELIFFCGGVIKARVSAGFACVVCAPCANASFVAETASVDARVMKAVASTGMRIGALTCEVALGLRPLAR